MPDKKNRKRKKSDLDTSVGGQSPEKLSDETRYEGYDEQINRSMVSRESDYDVNENNINDRSREYKNYGGEDPGS